MKKLVSTLLVSILMQPITFASLQLDDLTAPQESFYRLGTTDSPEIKSDFEIKPTVVPIVQKEVTVKDNQNITYADLSIKKMALEISQSLEIEYNEI